MFGVSKIKHSFTIGLRISEDLLGELEKAVYNEKKFNNISEAIRGYVKLGLKVESLKTVIKDPEFLKSIEFLKQTDGIFGWLETLNDQQTDAMAYAIQMEKERRYEKRDLR